MPWKESSVMEERLRFVARCGVEGAVGVALGLVLMGEIVGDPHSEI
jgi:hypothetical protein